MSSVLFQLDVSVIWWSYYQSQLHSDLCPSTLWRTKLWWHAIWLGTWALSG